MIKRVLTGVLAVGLAYGAAACDKQLDKEGSKEDMVEGGYSEEQADCVIDGVDREMDDDAIEKLIDGNLDELSAEEQQTLTRIFTECDALSPAGSTAPTG